MLPTIQDCVSLPYFRPISRPIPDVPRMFPVQRRHRVVPCHPDFFTYFRPVNRIPPVPSRTVPPKTCFLSRSVPPKNRVFPSHPVYNMTPHLPVLFSPRCKQTGTCSDAVPREDHENVYTAAGEMVPCRTALCRAYHWNCVRFEKIACALVKNAPPSPHPVDQ